MQAEALLNTVRGNPLRVLFTMTLPPPTEPLNRVLFSVLDITEVKRGEAALRQAHAELQARAEELTRFNKVAVGRELRMIELKKEINELCQHHGEPSRYALDFEQDTNKRR